jgi:magnesium transporter
MTRRKRNGLHTNPGKSPGTLTIPEGAPRPRLRWSRHSAGAVEQRDGASVGEIARLEPGEAVLWIEVYGYGDRDVLIQLERHFQIPRLALEDVLSGGGRPKLDLYGDALFVVARAAKPAERPEFEQISVFLRGRVVITFADEPLALFDALRERLRDPDSLTRRSGPDFLVYRILDCVVDSYVPCLEGLGARLEAIEAEVIERPSSKPLRTLYELMREVRSIHRVALPMRELAASLPREAADFFQPATRPFLADLRDHTGGAVELTTHYRELGTDVRELVLGSLNLKLNQAMRLLAAVSLVFLPLAFVTGVYGMNFAYMPETAWRYSYFVVVAILIGLGVVLFRWMQRLGWTQIGDE